MKTLKSNTRHLWTVTLLLMCCLSASAQTTNTERAVAALKKRGGAPAMLQQSLNLTDEQVKQLEPMFKEQQARVSALRTNTALSRQERMDAIKDMRKNADEKMKPHLTPEQLEKWRQMRGGPAAFSQGRATNRSNLPLAEKPKPQKMESPSAHTSSNTNAPAVPQESN